MVRHVDVNYADDGAVVASVFLFDELVKIYDFFVLVDVVVAAATAVIVMAVAVDVDGVDVNVSEAVLFVAVVLAVFAIAAVDVAAFVAAVVPVIPVLTEAVAAVAPLTVSDENALDRHLCVRSVFDPTSIHDELELLLLFVKIWHTK